MTCDIFEAMPLKGLPDFGLQCCHIDMKLRFRFFYENILFLVYFHFHRPKIDGIYIRNHETSRVARFFIECLPDMYLFCLSLSFDPPPPTPLVTIRQSGVYKSFRLYSDFRLPIHRLYWRQLWIAPHNQWQLVQYAGWFAFVLEFNTAIMASVII